MRKTLEIAALLLLLLAWAITGWAMFGPNRLPARIPTHFNTAGQADGFGTPVMLWLLPIVALILYSLMTVVARYPGAFHFPVRANTTVRGRLEAIALRMIVWLKAEVMALFAWIQFETIRLARSGEGTLPAWFLPAVLVAVFGTIAWHIAAMRRAVRPVS